MNYKSAQIYFGSKTGKDITKDWYVYYYYKHPVSGKWERFILKKGMNRLHTIKDRTQAAEEERDAVNLALKEGFSPYQASEASSERRGFVEALQYALELKKIYKTHKTYVDYRNHLKFISQTIDRLGYTHLPIKSISRTHIKSLFHELFKTGISMHRYNTFLTTAKSLLSTLVDEDIIEESPAHSIKKKKIVEKKGYKSYSLYLREVIKRGYMHGFSVGLLLETLYFTGMRPNECLGFQWHRLDLSLRIIELLPETEKGKITKTDNIRRIPVTDDLLLKYKRHYQNSCEELGLKDIPKDWFVFGTKHKFNSGPNRQRTDRLTELFRTKIRKDGQPDALPQWISLYGLKYTRVDDLIEAGVPLEVIRDLLGHASTKTTRIYESKLKDINAEIIRNHAPKFDFSTVS